MTFVVKFHQEVAQNTPASPTPVLQFVYRIIRKERWIGTDKHHNEFRVYKAFYCLTSSLPNPSKASVFLCLGESMVAFGTAHDCSSVDCVCVCVSSSCRKLERTQNNGSLTRLYRFLGTTRTTHNTHTRQPSSTVYQQQLGGEKSPENSTRTY